MKRLYGIAILFLLACGGGDEPSDPGDPRGGRAKPSKPGGRDAGAPLGDDAGSLAEDSGAEDAGVSEDAASPDSSAPAADAGSNDASSRADAANSAGFAGSWSVTLTATDDTTCTNAQQYEARIEDTWVFSGSTLTGDHLGPNPLAREPGTDVWSMGEAITADLTLVGVELHGTFVFYWDTCDVFYDVKGVRPE